MHEINSIDNLSKKQLLELIKIYALNWLAHDGCWFLSIEEKEGIERAIDYDRESWRKFTVIEAKRIIKFLELSENSGIPGLKKALSFRLYSTINDDRIDIIDENTLVYQVQTCRVQDIRRKKGLDLFPCKSVGMIEYSLFAETIDPRFKTTCITCPPDIGNSDKYCIWEFKIY